MICPDCYGSGTLESWDGTIYVCAICSGLGKIVVDEKSEIKNNECI